MDAMTVLTGVLVVITGIYAYLTHRMVKSSEASVALMKEQTEAISRPYIAISLVKPPNNPYIHLRIENTGRSAAHNVRFALGPEVDAVCQKETIRHLRESYLFTKEILSLPPGSPVLFLLGLGDRIGTEPDSERPQKTVSVTAEYGFAGSRVKETTWLDVNQYDNTILDTDPLVSAVQELTKAMKSK
jgi:hypothetical protein